MSGDQGSGFEWRRKRRKVNRTLERIEDVPWSLLSRHGAITDSAKRRLYEEGIPGADPQSTWRAVDLEGG